MSMQIPHEKPVAMADGSCGLVSTKVDSDFIQRPLDEAIFAAFLVIEFKIGALTRHGTHPAHPGLMP